MLKVELAEENNEMIVKKYNVSSPFNLYKNGTKKIYWNLNSFESQNIKNSFYLTVQRKVEPTSSGERMIFLFQKRLLFYINEKNPGDSYNGVKKEIANFLLTSERDIKDKFQFNIDYQKDIKIDGEKITFYLNLFLEK